MVSPDQCVSLVYTKYKNKPGVSEVIGWLDGWKWWIYWLPTFIGLPCTNVKPVRANSEHNWTADNMSWRATWDESEWGGALVTHISSSSSLWSSCGLTLTTECISVHFYFFLRLSLLSWSLSLSGAAEAECDIIFWLLWQNGMKYDAIFYFF